MVMNGWPTTHFSAAVPIDVIGCHPEDPAGTRQKYHLGVLDQNNSIPSGWLRVGSHRCVPRGACYQAHCGKAYVWVRRDGLPGLSEFTLVLLGIATTDPSWLAKQQLQAKAGKINRRERASMQTLRDTARC
jgi:hypothetical protein